MGLVADIGTLQRLPKIIPSAMAAEMAYTGRNVYGPEAKEIGLVNQCYQDKEMMMENIQDIANTIAEKSPLVIRGTKHIIQYTRDHTVHDSLQYMATYNAAYLMSDDLKESFEATIQKRKPVYND
jgi:enoyl-CoA hydratase